MFRVILLLLFTVSLLFSLDVSNQESFENILPTSKIYIDKTNTLTIDSIQAQHFLKIGLTHQIVPSFGFRISTSI